MWVIYHSGLSLRPTRSERTPDDRCGFAIARKPQKEQAYTAWVRRFAYDAVLGCPLGDVGTVVRAKRPHRLPVALSRDEVERVLGALGGVHRLVGGLLYGSGLRVREALCLRVHDLDFAAGRLTVREGKGGATTAR